MVTFLLIYVSFDVAASQGPLLKETKTFFGLMLWALERLKKLKYQKGLHAKVLRPTQLQKDLL